MIFEKVSLVTGGFDPIHSGHLRYFERAKDHSDYLVVGLNGDPWLKRKKGYSFMKWGERAEIIRALRGVVAVEPVDDADGSVCEAIQRLRPTYFANGGDRKAENTPEVSLCHELGIELVWNVGGEKIQSSSKLVDKSRELEDNK